jgi:hypothetical protein
MEDVVHSVFVTVSAEAAAAKFTVPDGLSIVTAPVVPAAVFVAQ